jgi:hypothetical protein
MKQVKETKRPINKHLLDIYTNKDVRGRMKMCFELTKAALKSKINCIINNKHENDNKKYRNADECADGLDAKEIDKEIEKGNKMIEIY